MISELTLLNVLCLVVDLCHVIVGTHMDNPRIDKARINKAAAHDLGPRGLADEVALAREEALVYLGLARHHRSVSGESGLRVRA